MFPRGRGAGFPGRRKFIPEESLIRKELFICSETEAELLQKYTWQAVSLGIQEALDDLSKKGAEYIEKIRRSKEMRSEKTEIFEFDTDDPRIMYQGIPVYELLDHSSLGMEVKRKIFGGYTFYKDKWRSNERKHIYCITLPHSVRRFGRGRGRGRGGRGRGFWQQETGRDYEYSYHQGQYPRLPSYDNPDADLKEEELSDDHGSEGSYGVALDDDLENLSDNEVKEEENDHNDEEEKTSVCSDDGE